VVGTENIALIRVVKAPARDIDRGRMRRIEDDVIQNVIVAWRQVSKQRPRLAAVLRIEHLSGAGAQQNALGIRRIVRQAANVAALGSDQPPVRRESYRG